MQALCERWEEDQKRQDLRWAEVQRRQDMGFGLIAATLYNIAAIGSEGKVYMKPGGGMFTPGDFFGASQSPSSEPEVSNPGASEEEQQMLAFMNLFGWPGPKEKKKE